MAIKTLFIECLRNISRAHIELSPAFNLFYGKNGAGKTSVLEAVDLISNGRTFRTRYTKPLIKDGSNALKVRACLSSSAYLEIEKTYKATRAAKNGKAVSKQSQISEVLPVWSIHPDSHELIQGGRSSRRKFMDKGVFHVKHDFYSAWKSYQKALRQRNYLLTCGGAASKSLKEQTKGWEIVMADSAQKLDSLRESYIQRLRVYINKVAAKRNGMPIKIVYRRGWEENLPFSEYLKNNWNRDRERGYTQAGPHRAELGLLWEDKPAAEHASRGQQKVMAVALLMAQVKMFCECRGQEGILLADDIFAEMDAGYLDWTIEQLNELNAQFLITKTSRNCPLPEKDKEVKMFHVKHGGIYFDEQIYKTL